MVIIIIITREQNSEENTESKDDKDKNNRRENRSFTKEVNVISRQALSSLFNRQDRACHRKMVTSSD